MLINIIVAVILCIMDVMLGAYLIYIGIKDNDKLVIPCGLIIFIYSLLLLISEVQQLF